MLYFRIANTFSKYKEDSIRGTPTKIRVTFSEKLYLHLFFRMHSFIARETFYCLKLQLHRFSSQVLCRKQPPRFVQKNTAL